VGLGLIGAPLAMLASQLLAALPRARFVLGGRGLVQPSLRFRGHTLGPLREILRVGVPASLSTVVANLGIVVLTGVVARLGDAHLAAYGLGTRLDFLLLSFCYGFAAALLTLVGLATGAGRPDRALAYVFHTGAMAVALIALPAAALCWRPRLWLALFTHDAAVLAVGTEYFRLIGPSYPFVAISMVLSFAFQGLGRATTPLLWMTVRMVGVLAVAIACTRWLGLGARAVFATIAAGNVVAGLGMVALFGHVFRRLDTGGRRR
jgi:Na+-driven multidrug efflux pump